MKSSFGTGRAPRGPSSTPPTTQAPPSAAAGATPYSEALLSIEARDLSASMGPRGMAMDGEPLHDLVAFALDTRHGRDFAPTGELPDWGTCMSVGKYINVAALTWFRS